MSRSSKVIVSAPHSWRVFGGIIVCDQAANRGNPDPEWGLKMSSVWPSNPESWLNIAADRYNDPCNCQILWGRKNKNKKILVYVHLVNVRFIEKKITLPHFSSRKPLSRAEKNAFTFTSQQLELSARAKFLAIKPKTMS